MAFHGLHLETWDLDTAKTFYTRNLAMPLVEEDADEFVVQAGATRILFSKVTTDAQPSYRVTFGLGIASFENAVNLIKQTVKLLQHNGETIITSPISGKRAVYAYDAVGNLLEFASELDGVTGIGGVTAVGLAVDNVPDTANKLLQDQINLTLQPDNDPDVSVLRADANSCLILTQKGKRWFPGRRPAEVHWMMMTLPGGVNTVAKVSGYPYYIHRGDGWPGLR
jgi:hypothetical protein